ncbi:hypothetical protein BDV97DRAFT_397981 [Delphinella strobiligena]|nr:hypothetical protein BDV97DRAFT_397981 [Delphinella strobiligena]
MDPSAASVHLVPNPDFVFPARPTNGSSASSVSSRRPVSMHLNLGSVPVRGRAHQRQSVSTLPTFTFNATDTSGLSQSNPPLASPALTIPSTPARGHRRRASEFVGGDSRYGVSTLVSTSPSKPSETLPLPSDKYTTGSPGQRRGHAHRRSAAISGHDLASILQPRDANAAPQMSVPSLSSKEPARTPSPPCSLDDDVYPAAREFTFGASSSGSPSMPNRPFTARPASRPRVGFSENVEYIPRPLSTVSSDTTSSASTICGHSVGNSISSMISLGGIGTPSPRRSRTPPSMDLHSAPTSTYRSSFESKPALESQNPTLDTTGKQSLPEPTGSLPKPSAVWNASAPPKGQPKKKHSSKLDRRRSEPLISASAFEQPALSTVSLHDPVMTGLFQASSEDDETAGHQLNRKSSRRKVKAWANAFLGRKTKDPRKTKSMTLPTNTHPSSEPDMPTPSPEASLEAEPDLDAVFSQDPFGSWDDATPFSFTQSRPQLDLQIDYPSLVENEETGGRSPMIDLDAALGPYGTPPMGGARRQMHSGGFGRRGAERTHNRTYSLPTLAPFQFDRSSSPVQPSMADVFEEDEEAEIASARKQASSFENNESDDEDGTGIEIVDAVADHEESTTGRITEQGLGIQPSPQIQPITATLPLPSSPTIMRRTSVVEDTIIEEASPIEIVGDHEEPRTSSVTKSSESSETSTLLAERRNVGLSVPQTEPFPLTPPSYHPSTFSSPETHGQHGLFDASRLGTSGSSIGDNRTVSSFATGEHGLDMRMSVDDVPSLTSSRSTMISGMHNPMQRRDFSDRSGSVSSVPAEIEMLERRRKRSSIQSLAQLVGGSFGDGRSRSPSGRRPQTAAPPSANQDVKKRKETRLSKLMFWRSKSDRSVSSPK